MLLERQQRTAWTPATEEDRAAVHAELKAVLRDAQFAHSKRYPALLRYLVEHTLDGDVAQIKERTLGIEVFGRSATYDTTNDTVVRFTASEVRRRLATFYLQNEDRPIQITLPTGSYVPEFLRSSEALQQPGPEIHDAGQGTAPAPLTGAPTNLLSAVEPFPSLVGAPERPAPAAVSSAPSRWQPLRLATLGFVCAVAIAGTAWLAHRHFLEQSTAIDRLWSPLAHDAHSPLIVAGGNIFSSNPYSGTETASREVDYPFVSMQIASAMARISAVLQREGSLVDVQAANNITLSELRDRPLVLIGGYNNDWTVRLTDNLPIRLAPKGDAAIEESGPSGQRWQRDMTQPYAAADDFALVGQYRDSTTGNAIVILAGIGRNGSEAAAQFLTDERRLRSLEDRMHRKLVDVNFEAVLRVPVVQGRTGAPSILSVKTW